MGLIDLDILQGTDLLRLLVATEELDLQKLNAHIQTHMISKQTEFIQEDTIDALQTVIQHEKCTVLKDFCMDIICKEPTLLFDSSKFYSLDESILKLFLQQDDLAMEELEIWQYLLKWGLAQMENKINVDN